MITEEQLKEFEKKRKDERGISVKRQGSFFVAFVEGNKKEYKAESEKSAVDLLLKDYGNRETKKSH